MAHRYRVTQSFEISVEDERVFLAWAEQVVEPADSEQTRVTSGLMSVAARALDDVPGLRLHASHTNVHRLDPGDDGEQIDLRKP